MKKALCWAVAILGFFTFCLVPNPQSRAWANKLGTELELTAVPAASIGFLSLTGYMLWKYRLSQPPDALGREGYRGPGEFYFGSFMGVSLVNTANWSFEPLGINPLSGNGIGNENVTAKNVKTDPSLVGGVKAGYFLDSIPYLGFEGEGSVTNNFRPRQVVAVKPPLSTSPAITQEQTNLIWIMAFNIVGRYGFFPDPDKDIPFGRLQPYIGIGPGVGVLYFQNDSAKNFGLNGEAGVRYMFTRNIAAFVEFDYFKQWDVQLGVQHLTIDGIVYDTNGEKSNGKTVHFDFDNQKIVCGLEYHF
ncbi:MAG: outer membrane beta-barrel protein [Desulfobaccales bacterium]|jgi:opacity protein-like surface antigen